MTQQVHDLLSSLGVSPSSEGGIISYSPIDGSLIGAIQSNSIEDVALMTVRAQKAFLQWREIPAPVRGELVRLFGDELRNAKESLGALVTWECGKILSEGYGEVQEMIDICDFAVGLSRQLYGKTIVSERPQHHMRELWHSLGPVGVISSFNFPVAVWAWNSALAFVCGNSVIWKPSEKTPFVALACDVIFKKAVSRFKAMGHDVPDDLFQLLQGGRDVSEALVHSEGVPLISATGSTEMGRSVYQNVSKRFGRCLLELGGNNAMILAPSADMDMALKAAVFSAVGTAGQRCTSLRRLIVHKSVSEDFVANMKHVYETISIGNPLEDGVLIGPLMDEMAFDQMQLAIEKSKEQGGTVVCGGDKLSLDGLMEGFYVRPAIIKMPAQSQIVEHETFAPILYVLEYDELSEAIDLQNAVPQGLSSCIFSNEMKETELFLSTIGSDCGIANVNIGTSGAEIGGAFGGEKETGGGRESGSGAWKTYMRRQTQTINYSSDIPLAQGVQFSI
ncbi:MAG: aldehyde dehydrogenase family protein [Alphaproteobacteria bacterium]|nr:aldehyde dehydrogenase family protein [Alphaproteobacteria bacterium]